MKITKILSFLLLCAVIFLFGCDKGNKTDYPEDDDTDTVSDIDSDTENNDTDSSENETDEDQTPVSDSDIDNNPTDEPHPHDDADSDPDDIDPTDDADSDPTENPDPEPTDDADSEPDDDTDSEPVDEDTDTEPVDEDSDIEESEDPEVICTGQTKCFNNEEMISCPASQDKNFFGQDAQYAEKGYCLDTSLDATTDLVTDNITGLVWQRKLPSNYAGCTGTNGTLCSYSEAANYCNDLNYAGKTDWRLPSQKELGTIIDYGKANPSINSEKFPETKGNLFWTSENYDGEKQWTVNFLKGETMGTKISGSYFYVRCVRGESLIHEPSFTVSGTEEKIVKDSINNLTWTQSAHSSNLTWEDALAHCKNLAYADLSNWRLPNINELKTLINYSKSKPASDFEGMSSATFWSSTSYSNDGTNAWTVSMEYGITRTRSKDNEFKVICVK